MTKGDICRIIMADGAFFFCAGNKKGVNIMRMDKSKTNLILTIREGKRIIEAGKLAVKTAEDAIETIQADEDRSDSYKAKRTDEIRDNLDHALRELSSAAEVVYTRLDERLQASLNDFDYGDSDFQKALTAISALGKALPFSMQDQIASNFRAVRRC